MKLCHKFTGWMHTKGRSGIIHGCFYLFFCEGDSEWITRKVIVYEMSFLYCHLSGGDYFINVNCLFHLCVCFFSLVKFNYYHSLETLTTEKQHMQCGIINDEKAHYSLISSIFCFFFYFFAE